MKVTLHIKYQYVGFFFSLLFFLFTLERQFPKGDSFLSWKLKKVYLRPNFHTNWWLKCIKIGIYASVISRYY